MHKTTIDIKVSGFVKNIKKPNQKGEVNLQLLHEDDIEGDSYLHIKVIGASREDLLQFKGKYILASDISMAQVDYNTYYKVFDISKIEIIKDNKS